MIWKIGLCALHIYPELCLLDSGFHSNFLAVLVQSINFLLNVFFPTCTLIARQY